MPATTPDPVVQAFDGLACALLGKALARPWHPVSLDEGSASMAESERMAVGFLLRVWSRSSKWKTPFDLHSAVSVWDPEKRAAVAHWFLNPFWP